MMEVVVMPWDDGFRRPGTLVRYPGKKANFLDVYDDVLPEKYRREIYEVGVTAGKPWGVYLRLEDVNNNSSSSSRYEELARVVVREVLEKHGYLSDPRAHGVAVWCLASDLGAAVEYHLDYSELHRYETNEIVPPLVAGTYQASDIDISGGDFVANTRGLDHYEERGYKAPVDETDEGWVGIPYRANRAIVHDGEYPHYASKIQAISRGSRVILGFNVFSDRVREANERAPEHSDAFNATVKLYQAANRYSSSTLTLDAAKRDAKLAKFLVALARKKIELISSSSPSSSSSENKVKKLSPGDRVLARWRTGLRAWPATVKAVNHADDLHDLHYEDGSRWSSAPARAIISLA